MSYHRNYSYAMLKFIVLLLFTNSCNSQSGSSNKKNTNTTKQNADSKNFKAGKDYVVFKRVRIMDREAFTEPAEAYSILLPEGWTSEGGVFWTAAGQTCAGTNMDFSAKSPDGKSIFDRLPHVVFSWSNDMQANEMSRQYNTSKFCSVDEPVDATTYVKEILLPQLGNAVISNIKPNEEVVRDMGINDTKFRNEMMRYGASQVNFRHTAVTARLKWNDGTAGILMCGVSNVESYVPNNYTGTYNINYTSSASRMLYTFPESEQENAEKLMTVMVSSFRTNPDWKKATDDYWKSVREKKHIQHLGTIKLMDDRTRQIANSAIQKGNQRLAEMDNQARSWESGQNSQDKMHNNFIKTIREVEHYRDDNGKVELSAGYNHAWSRNDGNHFILSNNPNFDPSSVLQDNSWKEMNKVD